MTYSRILTSKFWREGEETAKGRLERITPELGLFHLIWDLGRLVLDSFWGDLNNPGSLGYLAFRLAPKLGRNGKTFNDIDDFLFVARNNLIVSYFAQEDKSEMTNKEKLSKQERERLEKSIDNFAEQIIVQRQREGKNLQVFETLFAVFIFTEVSFSI